MTLLQEYADAKNRHPDRVVLLHKNGRWVAIGEDAKTVAKSARISLESLEVGGRGRPRMGISISDREVFEKLAGSGLPVALCETDEGGGGTEYEGDDGECEGDDGECEDDRDDPFAIAEIMGDITQ